MKISYTGNDPRPVLARFYSPYHPNRLESERYFDERGVLHRDPDEGPALREFFPGQSEPYLIEYRWRGFRHREDGPAVIRSDKGYLCLEQWYRYGNLHRDPRQGPAQTRYWEGRRWKENYFVHGYWYRHPHDGPKHLELDNDKLVYVVASDEGFAPPDRPVPTRKWLRDRFGFDRPKCW